MQVTGEIDESSQGNLAGHNDAGSGDEKAKPANRCALRPEHGASGNSEQQELGIVGPMVGDQHGKWHNGSEREDGGGWRIARPESGDRPYEQECAAYEVADRVVDAGIVAEHRNCCLEIDDHAGGASSGGAGAGIIETAGPGDGGHVGAPVLHPMRGNMRDPDEGRDTKDDGDQQSLKRALAINPARQEEIEPDQTGVMGLDGKAGREAEDADRHKPLLKETPDGYQAKANDDASRVAGCEG